MLLLLSSFFFFFCSFLFRSNTVFYLVYTRIEKLYTYIIITVETLAKCNLYIIIVCGYVYSSKRSLNTTTYVAIVKGNRVGWLARIKVKVNTFTADTFQLYYDQQVWSTTKVQKSRHFEPKLLLFLFFKFVSLS